MNSTLDDRLRWIGLRISSAVDPGVVEADLEVTLLDGICEAREDYRLASVLFSWLEVHGNYVIVEKLGKLARDRDLRKEPWFVAAAAFCVSCGNHKWKKLTVRFPEPTYLMPKAISAFPIEKRGGESWLDPFNLLLPKRSLRIRTSDVMTPRELARVNRQYRNRYLYGPSWRADIITAIESGCETPTEISKAVGCSYEPAHRVLREYRVADEAMR